MDIQSRLSADVAQREHVAIKSPLARAVVGPITYDTLI